MLSYKTYGKDSNPPVVLLHGFLSDSRYWSNLVPILADEHFVITIDLLGFGSSPKPRQNKYDLEEHTSTVLETVLPLINQPAIFIGHSMGAMVAAELSRISPNSVEKLILSNPPLFPSSEDAYQDIHRTNTLYRIMLFSKLGLVLWPPLKILARFSGGYVSTSHTAWSRRLSLHNTIIASDGHSILRKLSANSVVIHGRNDRKIYQKLADRSYPFRNLWVESGHHTPRVLPEAIVEALKA